MMSHGLPVVDKGSHAIGPLVPARPSYKVLY